MKSFYELTLAEQRQISELINNTWLQSGELGAEPSEDTPPPRKTILIKDLTVGLTLPPADTLTVEQAERAARKIVQILAKRGVVLKGSKWLGSRQYYTWLTRDFLLREVRANVAPHRAVSFDFIRLEPNSLDNIFHSIEQFIRDLTCLDIPPAARWLHRSSPDARRLTDPRRKYLAAWQAAHESLNVERLRPTAVYDILSGGARVDFDIQYTATYENRARRTYAGTGQADLTLEGRNWRLTKLKFPGFRLPV